MWNSSWIKGVGLFNLKYSLTYILFKNIGDGLITVNQLAILLEVVVIKVQKLYIFYYTIILKILFCDNSYFVMNLNTN